MHAFRRPAGLLRRAFRPVALISAGGLLVAGLLVASLLGSAVPPAGAATPAGATTPIGAATSAGATTPTGAAAAAFHGYSVFEIHLSGIVSSLSVTRPDEALHIAGSAGCTVKFHGTPAYQTEWIGDEAGDWLELGTGHQCQGYQYWYAGYGSGGAWFPQWTKVTSTDGTHRFWIHGTNTPSGKLFTFHIGTKRYARVLDNLGSSFGQTGLESYASATKVPAYSMTLLRYGNGFGAAWHTWSGTRTTAPATSPLCERIVTATHVVSGENARCRPNAPSAAVGAAARVAGAAARVADAAARVAGAAARVAGATATRPGAVSGTAATRAAASTAASFTSCRRAARTWSATAVTRSYQDTAGAVRAWRQGRSSSVRAAYPLLASNDSAPEAVCYLSGSFAGIPAAPGYATNYRHLIVIVSETTGATTLDAAAHAATWPFAPPPAS